MLGTLLALSTLVASAAAQTPIVMPGFFTPITVQEVLIAVLVTIIWGFFIRVWFNTVGDAGVLDTVDYNQIRSGIAMRFCGFALLRRDVEKIVEIVSAVAFVVAASLFVTQSMLQFPVGEDGEVIEEVLSAEIPNSATKWVPIAIILYSAWFVQRLASGLFHSISAFTWSTVASFVAWGGWVALVVCTAIEIACPEPGQQLTEEIVVLVFALLQFLWSTYLAFWRLGFALVANDLNIGPSNYVVVGESGKRA